MAYKSAFQIDSTPEELNVRTVRRNPSLDAILPLALAGYCFYRFIPLLSPLFDRSAPPGGLSRGNLWPLALAGLFVFIAINFVFQGVRSFFPSGEMLCCDRANVVIGKIPKMNFTGKWTSRTFPVSSIKQMQFATIKITRYGGGTGLQFIADGATYKLFLGMESPEANTILNALQTLGVETIRDPAMPMMVEMVESRRKSLFGFF